MKKILFITGNKRKVWQAQDRLKNFEIDVEVAELDIPEIQSHDPLKIAAAKAEAAYAYFQRPLVICDHSWAVPALKGFPGGYMKDINQWFEAEDWLALMKGKEDRSAILTETVIYTDGETTQHFSVDFPAKIIEETRGTGANGGERVTIYDGFDETIAERVDKGEHARDMEKSAWQLFGEWYSKQNG